MHRRLQNSHTPFATSLKEIYARDQPSPLSQALNYELIRLGHSDSPSLEHALYREYKSQIAFFTHHEFKEGVRARLVDKDLRPKWLRGSIEEVTEEDIKYFLEFPFTESMEEIYDINKFPFWDFKYEK